MNRTPDKLCGLVLGIGWLFSIGCVVLNSISGTPVEQEPALPAPQTEPRLEPGAMIPISGQKLETLESYRMAYTASRRWDGEEGAMEELENVEYAVIRTWDAQYSFYDLQSTDPGTLTELWAGYQFGEEFFELELLPEGNLCSRWNTAERSLEDISVFHLEDHFDSLEIGEVVQAEELLHDVYTDHYRVGTVMIDGTALSVMEGEVWIERGTGYIVRFTGRAEGRFEEIGESEKSELKWDYNITESGRVENIPLPDECQEENLSAESREEFIEISLDDIPIPEEAYEVEVFDDTITFESPATPEETAGYYEFELARLGWEMSPESSDDEMLYLYIFEMGSRMLEVAISYNDQEGSSVMITEMES